MSNLVHLSVDILGRDEILSWGIKDLVVSGDLAQQYSYTPWALFWRPTQPLYIDLICSLSIYVPSLPYIAVCQYH